MKKVDRKNREIEFGDVVAFDVPVFYGTEEHTNKMWDIFWGKATEEGVMIDFCPITNKNNAIYKYPEDPSEILIIRKHVDMVDSEASPSGEITQPGHDCEIHDPRPHEEPLEDNGEEEYPGKE